MTAPDRGRGAEDAPRVTVDDLTRALEAAGDRAAPAVAATLGTERMALLAAEVADHAGPGAMRLLAHLVASQGKAEGLASMLSAPVPTASRAGAGEAP